MKQAFAIFSFLIVLTLSFATHPPQLHASGTTTTSTQSGQVIIRDENGVVYLTSTTNPDATDSARYNRILGTPLRIPRGFAKDVAGWINAVLSVVMTIAGLLVLMYLVWGAIDWLTSGGDKGKVDSARQKMMAAVVGVIIVSASYAILLLVIRFLGFSSLNDVFESVLTLDKNKQALTVVGSTTPSPTPSASPNPSATPIYSDNLGEVMRR